MKYKMEKFIENFSSLFNQEISGSFTTESIKDMKLEDFVKLQKAARLIEDAKEISIDQAEQIDRLEEKVDKALKKLEHIDMLLEELDWADWKKRICDGEE